MHDNVQLVGFVFENDPIQASKMFGSFMDKEGMDLDEIRQIVDYLESGTTILAWMGYFSDARTSREVSPHYYSSDGFWIWPSYLTYYLKEVPNFGLPMAFRKYLQEIGYQAKPLDKDEMAIMEERLLEELKRYLFRSQRDDVTVGET